MFPSAWMGGMGGESGGEWIRVYVWLSPSAVHLTHSIVSELAMCMHAPLRQSCQTPWTVAHQAPLSMGLPWQGYWSGLPCPPPGDLPNLGLKIKSPASSALAGRFFIHWAPGEAPIGYSPIQSKRFLKEEKKIPCYPSSWVTHI